MQLKGFTKYRGVQKTLNRARETIFWHGITQDINKEVQECDQCLTHRIANRKEPLITHTIPERPWQEIAIDFLEVKQKKWMVITDYFSSYIELVQMTKTTAKDVETKLKPIFAQHGIPERI